MIIKFLIEGHEYLYEVQTIIQVFFPNQEYKQVFDFDKIFKLDEMIITSKLFDNEFISQIYIKGELKKQHVQKIIIKNNESNYAKLSLFKLLTEFTKIKNRWGILTGVRPSKIAGKLFEEGLNEQQIIDYMNDNFIVSKEKSKLCVDVYKKEKSIIENNNGKDASLYIGIPFCPTRCLYCSFTAYPIKKYENIIPQYLDCLEKEMICVSKYFEKRRLESIYIGGGTPTSLNEDYLERLLFNVSKYFDIANTKEFTVEAGRPDTITKEKLQILKKYKVSRISINPQTMNGDTLKKIGREHSVSQFLESYQLAREVGFDNINVDIILGLPDETILDLKNTLEQIQLLNPESITVHTLAIKRASKLKEHIEDYNLVDFDQMEEMISLSQDYAKKMNMEPYYMYRQKNMLGNFENVGYCKNNFECIYNVQIMEEKQTIIAIGAGATSKIFEMETDKLERIFNVKSIEDYLLRIDEMLDRKLKLDSI